MKYAKSDKITSKDNSLTVGDLIRVHQKIYEEEKTRLQVFEGTVIALKNRGVNKSITVRKMSYDKVAIERIWPLDSPHIDHIDVKKKGDQRRAKLYFLRDRAN